MIRSIARLLLMLVLTVALLFVVARTTAAVAWPRDVRWHTDLVCHQHKHPGIHNGFLGVDYHQLDTPGTTR